MQLRKSWVPVASLAIAVPLFAQQPPPAATTQPLAVGAVAPDFSLPGATRYGPLEHPIHLSDFKGKTVVIAFFFKARTRG
jgi:thioredoxin-dependent peroxiredoxin